MYLKKLQNPFDLKEIDCSISTFGYWKLEIYILAIFFDITFNGTIKCKREYYKGN
jgi:hypothetical protein